MSSIYLDIIKIWKNLLKEMEWMKFVKEMILKNFLELNDMYFKVESMGSEKKIYIKVKYMKF